MKNGASRLCQPRTFILQQRGERWQDRCICGRHQSMKHLTPRPGVRFSFALMQTKPNRASYAARTAFPANTRSLVALPCWLRFGFLLSPPSAVFTQWDSRPPSRPVFGFGVFAHYKIRTPLLGPVVWWGYDRQQTRPIVAFIGALR